MAATLIVPAAWILARRLERCRALPPSASAWAAFLAALNPFYLWFGQEVRMYALVALMALLSTYMVLCWSEDRSPRRHWYVLGYLATVSLLLTAHYYSVFILPLQASIVYCAAGTKPTPGVVGNRSCVGHRPAHGGACRPSAYQSARRRDELHLRVAARSGTRSGECVYAGPQRQSSGRLRSICSQRW